MLSKWDQAETVEPIISIEIIGTADYMWCSKLILEPSTFHRYAVKVGFFYI